MSTCCKREHVLSDQAIFFHCSVVNCEAFYVFWQLSIMASIKNVSNLCYISSSLGTNQMGCSSVHHWDLGAHDPAAGPLVVFPQITFALQTMICSNTFAHLIFASSDIKSFSVVKHIEVYIASNKSLNSKVSSHLLILNPTVFLHNFPGDCILCCEVCSKNLCNACPVYVSALLSFSINKTVL